MRVPLRDERFDLEAILDAITERTKIVFIAAPNNPTGTTNNRDELDAYFARVPPHVLTVVDQAYFEYVDDPDYPDAVEEYLKAGHRVLVLQDVLEDLRPRRAARRLRRRPRGGRDRDREGAASVRRHLGRPGGGTREPRGHGRGRAPAELNREAMALLEDVLREQRARAGGARGGELPLRPGRRRGGAERRAAPSGRDRAPAGPFGAPDALRITAGTPDEIAFLAEALAAVAPPAFR